LSASFKSKILATIRKFVANRVALGFKRLNP
jgi:hypothetical protein